MSVLSSKSDTPNGRVTFVIMILILVTLRPLSAQSTDTLKKKISYHAILGGGISRFHVYELSSSPNYNSAEALVGIRASKPLGKFFSLMSGFSLGSKFKRESYFVTLDTPHKGRYTKEPAVVIGLDDSSSKKSGYYLSIPIALVVSINQSSTVYGGLNGRFWWHRSQEFPIQDSLTGLDELGIIFGASNRITNRLSVGLECYFGLKDIYYGGILLPGANRFVDLTVTNQNIMILAQYSLWVKK